MSTLVAYASKHGSTRGIAERIAERLRSAGLEAQALPVKAVEDVAPYDSVVLGSALYMFHWMNEAKAFARRNRGALAGRPVWLFSSGPFGPETKDKQGRDVLDVAGPREIDELREMLHPRDHQVFFGAWDRSNKPIGLSEHLMQIMPAAKAALPEGDFRDWPRIEAFADQISAELLRSKG
jgi:menaquinone-dependent protoporphyrinogen oxidase